MPYTCHLVHGKSRHNREAAGMPTTEIDRLTVEQLAEMESEEFDALRVRILESDPDTKRVGVARLTNLIERLNSEPEDELEDVHEVLGLRPVVFRSSDPHPDTRPCPTWCMLAGDSVPRHRIREYTPMDAMHELADCVDVRASFYGGQVTVQGDKLETAFFRFQLSQLGQSAPRISLMLTENLGGTGAQAKRLCQFSAEDAREVSKVLTYLADVAEGKRAPIGEGDES